MASGEKCRYHASDLNLYSTLDDTSQRMLNALEVGACVPIHRHLARQYGIQVPLGAWHSVVVLERSSILEAKDGVYVAAK